jgi:Zn-dependent peptidase ImmA (M78 family)
LSEAAAKIQVVEDKLASWEAGEDAPSISQLRKIATTYKRPLAVFYLQAVPTDFQVIRDLRRLPGSGFRRLPPALMLEVRRAMQRRALALELMDDLGQQFPTFTLQAALTEDAETVGARIRNAFKITNDEQAKWRDPSGRAAFKGWRSHTEDAGVLVFQATSFDAEEASGFAVVEDRAPLIVVNRKDAPTRRSFSLLHELAHLMLHVSGVSDSHTDDSRPPEDQVIEVFCNHAAAAALIPKGWLLSDTRVVARGARSTTWTDSEIADLARNFSVSREALVRRLLTFGRTTDAFYRQKRGQYLAEYLAHRQKQQQESSGDTIRRNMPQETVSNFDGPLVRMILGNYYQDRLTLSDVAGYLGIKTKHIPKLEQMAGF